MNREEEYELQMALTCAVFGAGSMMRADPVHAREALLKLMGQLEVAADRAYPHWAAQVLLLVKGMLVALDHPQSWTRSYYGNQAEPWELT